MFLTKKLYSPKYFHIFSIIFVPLIKWSNNNGSVVAHLKHWITIYIFFKINISKIKNVEDFHIVKIYTFVVE